MTPHYTLCSIYTIISTVYFNPQCHLIIIKNNDDKGKDIL